MSVAGGGPARSRVPEANGIGASLVLTRFLERFLWGVTRSDPAIFVAIAVILIATGLIASIVPGSRPARVDPLVALRARID